jgi:hypothetical protein
LVAKGTAVPIEITIEPIAFGLITLTHMQITLTLFTASYLPHAQPTLSTCSFNSELVERDGDDDGVSSAIQNGDVYGIVIAFRPATHSENHSPQTKITKLTEQVVAFLDKHRVGEKRWIAVEQGHAGILTIRGNI